MELQPQRSPAPAPTLPNFAEPPTRRPLVLLRDTERSLRTLTVAAISPRLPAPLAQNLGEASITAEITLEQLAEIDLDDITDADLRPARIQVGLIFIGFGALMTMFLLLYLGTLPHHPSLGEQLRRFWFAYIGCVCLGVAGLFMVGREAMRSPAEED